MNNQKFIGLLSGTSMDALDCVLVEFEGDQPRVLDFDCVAIPAALKRKLTELADNSATDLKQLGSADVELGREFAQLVLRMLNKHHLPPTSITAIASHGQTIWHQPNRLTDIDRFTLQIGDPNTIAQLTGITTIADFRRADFAAGGQGAPLVPAFHQAVLADPETPRVVLNLGGIANITVLPSGRKPALGYDTGPANILLDCWIQKHVGTPYDENGGWARSGRVNEQLLIALLGDSYFHRSHPKSTGREHFNLPWLEAKLSLLPLMAPQDVQATLVALTARSVSDAIKQHLPHGEVLVCGGGARNAYLLERLQYMLQSFSVLTTSARGIDPDCMEAVAFAWFAKQTLAGVPIDFTPFTGASKPVYAGGIYRAK